MKGTLKDNFRFAEDLNDAKKFAFDSAFIEFRFNKKDQCDIYGLFLGSV